MATGGSPVAAQIVVAARRLEAGCSVLMGTVARDGNDHSAGHVLRAPTADDAAAVAELLRAREVADLGEAEVTVADVRARLGDGRAGARA